MTVPARKLTVIDAPETWLSLDRAADLESWAGDNKEVTPREVARRIRIGRYISIDSGQRARNGRMIRLVALSSLSPEAQKRHLAQIADRVQGRAGLPVKVEKAASPEPLRGAAVPATPDGTPDLQALRAAGRGTEADIYVQRRDAVAKAVALIQRTPRGEKMTAWKRLEMELNTPSQTLRRWVKSYEKGGLTALVPGYGKSRGHYHAIPKGLQKAILAVYRNQQRQTITQIMRHTVRPWCAAHGFPAPSRTTVGRFLEKEVLEAERKAFRIGKAAWLADIAAKVTRDPNSLAVNDLWCADHRRLDVFVFGPNGRMIRPWLTLYVDLASAAFAGWCLRSTPTAQSVALALRAGILTRGAPRVLYHDNGKEFVAKRFGGKAARLTRLQIADPPEQLARECERWPALPSAAMEGVYGRALLSSLGIERVIHALPYHAWSKPIESMFRAFHQGWENLLPGYCGNAPGGRPEKLKAEMADGRLLNWQQFAELFMAKVDEWNGIHVCGNRRRTPDQAYDAARANGELRTFDPQTLDLLLMQRKNRKVTTQGIEVAGVKFLDENLALFVGETVEVLYDPDDLSAIIVRPNRNPNQRLIVSPIPHADWFEYSQANLITKRIQRAQRNHLKTVSADDRDALDLDHLDPTGANRLAVQNAVAARNEAKAEPLSGLKLIRAAKSEEDKTRQREKKSARKAASSIAEQIAAQARAEQAYRKGESA